MTTKSPFWDFFNNEAAAKLAHRERTFRKIFEYLDQLEGSIIIVETGCVRIADNWSGDGQSTVLFDRYINARDETSICYTVDINQTSIAECSKLVSHRVKVKQDDSVHFCMNYQKNFMKMGNVSPLLISIHLT